MGLCDRYEGRVHTEEGEGVPVIKGRERGSQRNCKGAVEEGLYLTIKVSTNGTSIFCRKEGWEKVDGTRLQVFKRVDSEE